MKTGFIITSALNTKFGVHATDARLQQTLDTIKSIKDRVPDAHITIIEMAGEPLTDEHRTIFKQHSDVLYDFTEEPIVKEIYKSDNWDVVKSLTELTCFGHTLTMIANNNKYDKINRFFKVSGRYLLNDDFTLDNYTNDKVVYGTKRTSQFDPKITGGVEFQYMSRCWSFPKSELINMISMFTAMRLCMIDILSKGGYLDIEHLLYLYSDPDKVLEIEKVGVQGLLGPNGILVKD
jgi:hypothetical protein